jgi:hypothetical protein
MSSFMSSFSNVLCSTGVAALVFALGACSSNSSSSGDVPFAGDSRSSDPAAAEQRLAANPNVPDSLHLLSPGRAGRLRLNMSEKELLKRVPETQLRRTTYQDKGTTYPAYEMLDAQKPDAPVSILHMLPDSTKGGYRLRRIRIYDPQYRTAEGIGVGSPFGAARQTMGLTRVRDTPAGFAGVSGLVKMAWVIDPNSLPAKHANEMNSADIPPAARITCVLLYQ